MKTDEKDEEEGTATVILKTQSINLAKIQSELMKDMQNAIKSGKIKKKEQLGSYILSKMAELIKEIKPTEEMKEVILTMKLKTVKQNKKEVKRWMPENSYTFGTQIVKILITQ